MKHKYKFDNWNEFMEKDPIRAHHFISHMLPGNLYKFMNTLLGFKFCGEAGMYVKKPIRHVQSMDL